MTLIKKICIACLITSCASSVFAETFNQNLEQLLECNKTLNDYYNLGFDFENDLKKNGWIKQGDDYVYVSKTPISVFGLSTHQISLVTGGMLAVLTQTDTQALAKKFKISQNDFFKGMPYFSGEKIVNRDPETKQVDKSVRKLTLAESNPNAEDGEHKTYLGCVYITEFEQQQQEAAIKALQ